MTPFAAVIGAGELGCAAAQDIARLDCAREVRLIDPAGAAARGLALDISQAAALSAHSTRVIGTADVRHAAGAAVIVFADEYGTPSREWEGETGLALVREVWSIAAADRSVLVCAGANQHHLLQAAVRELHVDRRRIVGTAPAAFESCVRALVAIALDEEPPRISLMVLGRVPSAPVVCWSQGAVNGAALVGRLGASQIAAIEHRLPRLWPPAPFALAAAGARATRAILTASPAVLTTSVFVDGEMRQRNVVTALPVRLGPEGVVTIIEPELSPQESTRLIYA